MSRRAPPLSWRSSQPSKQRKPHHRGNRGPVSGPSRRSRFHLSSSRCCCCCRSIFVSTDQVKWHCWCCSYWLAKLIGAQGNKRKYQSSRGWGGGEVEKGEEREEWEEGEASGKRKEKSNLCWMRAKETAPFLGIFLREEAIGTNYDRDWRLPRGFIKFITLWWAIQKLYMNRWMKHVSIVNRGGLSQWKYYL